MRKRKIEKHSKATHNFKYSGDITIKLTEDDRVYSENTYHNTGCAKLFNFLADCLTGDFNAAIDSRPCRIMLFKLEEDETDNSGNPILANLRWDDDTKVSTAVYHDSAVTPGATANGDCTVTYHFRVPYLCLVDGSIVRKLALYTDTLSPRPTSNMCAYFILPEENAIQIPTGGSNFTIIIDWKLHIYNAVNK